MKTNLLFSLVILVFIFSCKKETEAIVCEPSVEETYIPLTVGSYWIYQWYNIDTLGNETLLTNKIDTVRIVGDTLIGVNQYVIQEETYSLVSPVLLRDFYRDSLGYLVNSSGKIYFSSTNFTDTLRTETGSFHETNFKMLANPIEISTTAGDFECINFEGSVVPMNINVSWSERKINNYFARGVGKVMQNEFYFSSPDNLQRRLIEYKIE